MPDSQSLVDIKFAISQLGGNTELLQRMLGKFKDEFANVPAEVESLLAQNDLKEAKLKVHTTKGLAGNLGLVALYECSKLLDQQIRDEQVSDETLEKFSSLMRDTCSLINSMDDNPSNIADYSEPSRNESKSTVDLFLQQLNGNEFIDDEALSAYLTDLPLSDDDKRKLTELVEELHYDEAIAIIEKLK